MFRGPGATFCCYLADKACKFSLRPADVLLLRLSSPGVPKARLAGPGSLHCHTSDDQGTMWGPDCTIISVLNFQPSPTVFSLKTCPYLNHLASVKFCLQINVPKLKQNHLLFKYSMWVGGAVVATQLPEDSPCSDGALDSRHLALSCPDIIVPKKKVHWAKGSAKKNPKGDLWGCPPKPLVQSRNKAPKGDRKR